MNNTPFLKFNEFRNTIDYQKTPFSKAFDFSPWGGVEGFLEASKAGMTGYNNKGSQYRIFVPDVYRATDMTAVAVSSLPFDIMEGDKVIDSSENWQNKIGSISNPQRLIYNVASALCGGSAYLIPEGTDNLTVDLRFIPTSTISYTWNQDGIDKFFYNSQFGGSLTFAPDELIHFFLPDPDMENQPARAHPLGTAMSAAWRTMAMNNTINVQSERGFIPPTLVAGKGLIKTEVEKMNEWFNRWVKNPLKEVYKIINGDKIDIQKVGSGMDELKGVFVELKNDARIEVGQSFGIPAGIFTPDKSYASEMDVLYRQWYSSSVFVTIYQTISETMTDQYLVKNGLRWVYKPQTLKVFQDDEATRATAFRDYVSADLRPSLVAEMLGLDLPQGKQYKDFDEFYDKRLEGQNTAKPVNPLGDPSQPAPDPNAQPQPAMQPMKAIVLSPEEMKDLAVWFDKAKAWYKKGKGAAADWENKHLRESIATPIREKLKAVKSVDDIGDAFRIGEEAEAPAPMEQPENEIKTLAEAINAAIDRQSVQVVVNPQETKKPRHSTPLSEQFVKSLFEKE